MNLCFLLLHWHKVLIVCPYGGHFAQQKVFCVVREDGMPGLFEKTMSSLMDLMKLFYCLCLLLLYYEDTENSWCA